MPKSGEPCGAQRHTLLIVGRCQSHWKPSASSSVFCDRLHTRAYACQSAQQMAKAFLVSVASRTTNHPDPPIPANVPAKLTDIDGMEPADGVSDRSNHPSVRRSLGRHGLIRAQSVHYLDSTLIEACIWHCRGSPVHPEHQ